ncbi:MAG: hypothetical protein Q9174_001691 [Haloplaca sp. 1 TL-2023]
MSRPPSSNDTNSQRHDSDPRAPSSILVVGAGAFSLSTILALLSSPTYAHTKIVLVAPEAPDTGRAEDDNVASYAPNPHTASVDSSRIIRPDYANPAYAKLAAEGQELWRQGYGGEDVYHESGLVVVAGETGNLYVEAACQNVENICESSGQKHISEVGDPRKRRDVERLSTSQEIRAVMGPSCEASRQAKSTSLGSTGYINHTSGWANSEGAIRTSMRRITSFGPSRITFKRAKVTQLLFSDGSTPSVSGVVLDDKSVLEADLIILATGAWTGALLDLRGHVQATAQEVAYVPLTSAEAKEMGKMPVLLNLDTGYFVIPPAKNGASPSTTSTAAEVKEADEEGVYTHHLKLARHAHGYLNPTTFTLPLPGTKEKITTSLPSPAGHPLPPSAHHALRGFLHALFPPNPSAPDPIAKRPFTATRLCYYTDTPTGDFLICYHPQYSNLFLATGGSGHGFKFLPVLGEKVVEILQGKGGEWAELWRWRSKVGDEGWKGEGSRGGERGLSLESAMREGASKL